MSKIVLILLLLANNLMPRYLLSQKVLVNISVPENIVTTSVDSLFQVRIKNNNFEDYWVQDTTIIQNRATGSGTSFIIPYLEIMEQGKYNSAAYAGFSAYPAPDSCGLKCCNCIHIGKGSSITFSMPLLKPFRLVPGRYRLTVAVMVPTNSCNGCEQLGEFFSEYYYFTVRNDADKQK